MKHLVHAAAVAAVLLGASGAWAQQQPMTGAPVQIVSPSGFPVGTSISPLAAADPNNSAFHGARVLIPSGTAGQPGTIAGSPYPSTTGGTAASATNTGYSFSWVCSTAGVGTITTTDGSVLPFSFFANGAGGVGRDAYAIIDAEPGTASGCTFAVLR